MIFKLKNYRHKYGCRNQTYNSTLMIFTQIMSEYVTMKYVKFHQFSLTFKDFTAIVSSDKFFCAHLICMNIYALSYECFVEVCVQLEWQPTQRVQGCHSNWKQTSTKYEGKNAQLLSILRHYLVL